MELPRQPGPVKITICAEHPEDRYKAILLIKRAMDHHYASINGYDDKRFEDTYVIDGYPFAVND